MNFTDLPASDQAAYLQQEPPMRPDLDALLEGTGLDRETIIRAALVAASPEAFDCESQRRFEGIEAQPVDEVARIVAYLRERAEACLMLRLRTGSTESKAVLHGAYLGRLDDADAIEAGKHREKP